MNFSKTLINWYLENKRNLPWRDTNDPYRIWLSEIILQQTRVEQGRPYYLRFVERFPTVFDLAAASEEQVLKLWQGLGYYSRARNLHHSAQLVAGELKGVFPTSYKDLLRLKGVGEYTASAIASICYSEPVAVLDGNVFRVLSRIFGIATPVNSTEGLKQFKVLAQSLLENENPSDHNQGLMEFGALQCKPQLPECGSCPFATECTAYRQQRIQELPVKLKKQKIKKRHFNYLVLISEDKETILQQRTGKGIWRGLYEFPLIETLQDITEENLVKDEEFLPYLKNQKGKLRLYNEEPIIHKLSHQHIHTRFWILNSNKLPGETVQLEKVADFPVPALIGKFIEDFGF